MTIEELSSVLQMQEEILQFSSFTNADAWELGNLIVAEAAKEVRSTGTDSLKQRLYRIPVWYGWYQSVS